MTDPSLRVIAAGSFYNLIRNHSDLFYNQQDVFDLKQGEKLVLTVERKDEDQREGFWVHVPDEKLVEPEDYEQAAPYWIAAGRSDVQLLSGNGDVFDKIAPVTRGAAGQYAFLLYRDKDPKDYAATSLRNVIPYSLFTVRILQVDDVIFVPSGAPLLLSVPKLNTYSYKWYRIRFPNHQQQQEMGLADFNADEPGRRYASWNDVRREYIDVEYAEFPETTRYIMYLELLSVYVPTLVSAIDGPKEPILIARNMKPGSSIFLCYRQDDTYELAGKFEVHVAPFTAVTESSGLPKRRVESLFQQFLDSQEEKGRRATLKKVFRPDVSDIELYPPIRESLRDKIFPAWEEEYLRLQAIADWKTTSTRAIVFEEDTTTAEKKQSQVQRLQATGFFEAQQWNIRRPAQYTAIDKREVVAPFGTLSVASDIRWYTVYLPDAGTQLVASDSYALVFRVLQALNTGEIARQLLGPGSQNVPTIRPDSLEQLPTNSYFVCLGFEVYTGNDRLFDEASLAAVEDEYSDFGSAAQRKEPSKSAYATLRQLKQIVLVKIDFNTQRSAQPPRRSEDVQLKADVREAVREVYKNLNIYSLVFNRVIENRATAKRFIEETLTQNEETTLNDLLNSLEQARDNREVARKYQLFKSANGTDGYWVKPNEREFRPIVPMRFGEQVKLFNENAPGVSEEGANWMARCFSQPDNYTAEEFVQNLSNAAVVFRIYRTIKKQLRTAQEALPLSTNFRMYAAKDDWVTAELMEQYSRGRINGETIDSVSFIQLVRWMMLSVKLPGEFLEDGEEYPAFRVNLDNEDLATQRQYLERANIGEILWYDYNRNPIAKQPLYKVEKANGGPIQIPASGPRAEDTYGGGELRTQVHAIQQALQPDNLISALLGDTLTLDQLVDLSTVSKVQQRQQQQQRKYAIEWIRDIFDAASLPLRERVPRYVEIVSENISEAILEFADPEPAKAHIVPTSRELQIRKGNEAAALMDRVGEELEESVLQFHQLNYYQDYSKKLRAIRSYLIYAVSDLIDLYIALMIKGLLPNEFGGALGLRQTAAKIATYPARSQAAQYKYLPSNTRQTTLVLDVQSELRRIREILYSESAKTALTDAIVATVSVGNPNVARDFVADLREMEKTSAAVKQINLLTSVQLSRIAAGIEAPQPFFTSTWLGQINYERYVQEQFAQTSGFAGKRLFEVYRSVTLLDTKPYESQWIALRRGSDLSSAPIEQATPAISIIADNLAKRTPLSMTENDISNAVKKIARIFSDARIIQPSAFQAGIVRNLQAEAIRLVTANPETLPSVVLETAFNNCLSAPEELNREGLQKFFTTLGDAASEQLWRQYWPFQKLANRIADKSITTDVTKALYQYLELPDQSGSAKIWIGRDNNRPKITDIKSESELRARLLAQDLYDPERQVTEFVRKQIGIPVNDPIRVRDLAQELAAALSLNLDNNTTWAFIASILLPKRLQRIVMRLSKNQYAVAVRSSSEDGKWNVGAGTPFTDAQLLSTAQTEDYALLLLPNISLAVLSGLLVMRPPAYSLLPASQYLNTTYSRLVESATNEPLLSSNDKLTEALNTSLLNKVERIQNDPNLSSDEAKAAQIQKAMQDAAQSYALLEESNGNALFNRDLASAAYESELNVVKDSLQDIFVI